MTAARLSVSVEKAAKLERGYERSGSISLLMAFCKLLCYAALLNYTVEFEENRPNPLKLEVTAGAFVFASTFRSQFRHGMLHSLHGLASPEWVLAMQLVVMTAALTWTHALNEAGRALDQSRIRQHLQFSVASSVSQNPYRIFSSS